MIDMTLAEIAAVVDGVAYGDATVTAPAFLDSRAAEPGGLFVAIAGERVDGHDFAASALAGGAAAVLGSKQVDGPCVVVADPAVALGRLARHVLDRLPDTLVLALTGSQGKTGTKDYLAQVLATAGPTVATLGNLNNELGVPLTVLRATPETRFLVVEMGARGIGHIAYLCEIAPPRIAAVLNIGTAHMSEFGSREAIAQAKGEILEALPEDGVAVLPQQAPEADPLVAALHGRTRARVTTFGADPIADVHTHDVTTDELGRPSAALTWTDLAAGERYTRRVLLQQLGGHQVDNAAAAAAMALGAGLAFEDVVDALGRATSLSRWRMELHERSDGLVVVNDAYNANPESMAAGLRALADIRARSGRRAVAVLGEMKELGASHDSGHRQVGAAAANAADVLVVIGEPAREILAGFREAAGAGGETEITDRTAVLVPDREAAVGWLRQHVDPGDVVLVKASRGAGLEVVADALLEEPEADEEQLPVESGR